MDKTMNELAYKVWVRSEAKKIGADGCSVVSEWNQDACLEHDLAYHYKKDPKHAYDVGWEKARDISKWRADGRFWMNNARKSPTRATIRYLGVTLGGWGAWLKKR